VDRVLAVPPPFQQGGIFCGKFSCFSNAADLVTLAFLVGSVGPQLGLQNGRKKRGFVLAHQIGLFAA
jgi:hypothetical protein